MTPHQTRPRHRPAGASVHPGSGQPPEIPPCDTSFTPPTWRALNVHQNRHEQLAQHRPHRPDHVVPGRARIHRQMDDRIIDHGERGTRRARTGGTDSERTARRATGTGVSLTALTGEFHIPEAAPTTYGD